METILSAPSLGGLFLSVSVRRRADAKSQYTLYHSIVTNLYGMHANLSKEEEIRQENGFTLVKVIVDYEPSPAQQKKGTKAWQEQHYLFMNGTDTFFDLWVNTEELSEETINNLIDTFHIS